MSAGSKDSILTVEMKTWGRQNVLLATICFFFFNWRVI